MNPKNFLIIDGNSIVHRAYHALPPLTAPDGQIVNAIYGFLMIFLKAVKDFSPGYMAACFDFPAKTFRHEKYVDYKATRVKAPQELYDQIPQTKRILKEMGVAVFERQRYEADDLIATIAKKSPDLDKIIVSGDMDNAQLIDEHTKLFGWAKKIKDTVIYDRQKVFEHFGVYPEQVVDYKALVGDASDNIPGAKGIGPKTAVELLQNYKTVKALLDALETDQAWDLNEKIKSRILENKEKILLSYDLATANFQALDDFDVLTCKFNGFDKEKTAQIFNEYGFRSLLDRV